MRGLSGWRDERRIGPNIHPTPPVKNATTAQTGKRHASTYKSTANEQVLLAFWPCDGNLRRSFLRRFS